MTRAMQGMWMLGLGLSMAAGAHAAVGVEFVKPDHYTDAGTSYGHRTDSTAFVLTEFEKEFKSLGERCLAAGQTLNLKVLDIRLAGNVEWWHRRLASSDARVMRDSTWPSMVLEYSWTDAAGASLGQAKETVADQTYLWHSTFVRNQYGAFPYEKAMLADWFHKRFCPQAEALGPAPRAASVGEPPR